MKFSVVTPSYKQLSWLELCVASVSDQVGAEVEHIIQDAGTEGVEEVLKSKIASSVNPHHSLKLFVEEDAGMYDAVNRGLRRSSGDICAYLNCDEQYLPGTLVKAARFFAAHPATDVLFGDAVLINEDGSPISYRRTIMPRLHHIQLSHLNTLSCAMFFRRRLLDRGFYFDPAWKDIGDGIWVERLLTNRVQMATLPEPLAVFAFTGENRSTLGTASREVASRKSADGASERFRRLSSVIAHRVRKALAGAYRSRVVEIDVFTHESPDTRTRKVKKDVGFRWPST